MHNTFHNVWSDSACIAVRGPYLAAGTADPSLLFFLLVVVTSAISKTVIILNHDP